MSWWHSKPTFIPEYKEDEHGVWHFVLRNKDGKVEVVANVRGFDSEEHARAAVDTLSKGFHIGG